MINRFVKIALVCSFFSFIPQIQASAQGKRRDLIHLEYFFLGEAITLTRMAFDWLLAQLYLVNIDPDAIPLSPRERTQAQKALDGFLKDHENIQVDFDADYEDLQKVSLERLINIILNPAAPAELSFVAQLVLTRKYIRPAFENDDFETIRRIRSLLIRRGLSLGRTKNDLRGFVRKLFPPNRKQSAPGELQDSTAQLQGKRERLEGLARWKKENQFSQRLKSVHSNYAHPGSVHEIVQLEISNLEGKRDEAKAEGNLDDFIGYHVQILELIELFETLPAETDPFQVEIEESISPHQAIQNAMNPTGGSRFEADDPVLHAQVMGFVEDHEAIKKAEANDRTPDKQHRLSKGGNNRFIRGDLIISVDRDGHAGGAYKLFVKKNSGWVYEDTVIPVEINGSWMLLLLNRKKNASGTYWYLVDETGKWWRLHKSDKEAVLEEVNFSDFAPPPLNARKAKECDN